MKYQQKTRQQLSLHLTETSDVYYSQQSIRLWMNRVVFLIECASFALCGSSG